MQTYNHPAQHRLIPVAGYNQLTHLQFTAPMEKTTVSRDNGYGEPMGLPAGSVTSLNDSGQLIAGCTGKKMPLFLFWDADDNDGYAGYLTADGTNLTSVSGNSFGGDDIQALWDRSNDASGGAGYIRVQWTDGAMTATSGSAVGNFKTYPATCAMELTSTEYDKTKVPTDFAPNTQLTSPEPAITSTETAQTPAWYQQLRGGYLTPAEAGDNVCGVVSRPPRINENGVMILSFWPCYCPGTATEGDGA
ncbi:MAG: hypothetical protein Q4D38_00065 [Planctomycetia bacterium]|nr:hypothetical protein [Planctomycetia bacterium]